MSGKKLALSQKPIKGQVIENFANIETRTHIASPLMFAITAWWIWRWHNGNVFHYDEGMLDDPYHLQNLLILNKTLKGVKLFL